MSEAPRRRRFRPRRRPRLPGLSFNKLIPNLLTLIGLCAGLTSIRFALENRYGAAVTAITVAGFIDGLDGRIARMLKATSRFGAEFDSLSDFLCFGVAPALIVYMWALQDERGYGYAPCILFAVCMGLRLARFNASLESEKTPAYAYNFFSGVPAPAGAGLALLPLLIGLEAQAQNWTWLMNAVTFPLVPACVLIAAALLLVSTLPVWSFKNFKIPSAYILPTLLGVGLYAAFLLADPWAAMALLGVLYVATLPFGLRSFRRLKREADQRRAELTAADDPLTPPA